MRGKICDAAGNGLSGIVVSNGHDSVVTQPDGSYELPEQGTFVVVTRPASTSMQTWWQPAADENNFTINEAEQSLPFTFAHVTDTHVTVPGSKKLSPGRNHLYEEGATETELTNLLTNIGDIVPGVQAVFITGDLVDNGTDAEYEGFKLAVSAAAVPVFYAAGNHDHMTPETTTTVTDSGYMTNTGHSANYERHLGPRWYSFDIPGLHCVVMDWHTFELGLDAQEQLDWLAGDLALVPAGKPWILLFHDQPSQAVMDRLPRTPLATFSGHWHTSRAITIGETLHVNTRPPLFGGLDYAEPMIRAVTWNGTDISFTTITGRDIASTTRSVDAIRHSTGEVNGRAQEWISELTEDVVVTGLAANDSVVVATAEAKHDTRGLVASLNCADGSILWCRELNFPVKSAATITTDAVFVQDVIGSVYAFERQTGEAQWTADSPDKHSLFCWSSPALLGDKLIVGAPENVRCLAAASGQELWRQDRIVPHHNLLNHLAPIENNGRLFLGLWPRPDSMVVLDAESGEWINPGQSASLRTSGELSKKNLFTGGCCFDEKRNSIIMNVFGATVSFDVESFAPQWRTENSGAFNKFAPIITDSGIWVITPRGEISILDPQTGEVTWREQLQCNSDRILEPYRKDAAAITAQPGLYGNWLLVPVGNDGIRIFESNGDVIGHTRFRDHIGVSPIVKKHSVILAEGDHRITSYKLKDLTL